MVDPKDVDGWWDDDWAKQDQKREYPYDVNKLFDAIFSEDPILTYLKEHGKNYYPGTKISGQILWSGILTIPAPKMHKMITNITVEDFDYDDTE